jgi:alpha-N-arabinofuranosidase
VAGKSAAGTGIFKAGVYNSTEPVPVSLKFEGLAKKGAKAELTVLTGPEDPYGYNDPHKQNNVVKETKLELAAGPDGAFDFSLPPLSIAVLETKDKITPCRPPRRL